jgi:hypothetical protein
MKNSMTNLKIALVAGTLAVCMLPKVGWCTHPIAAPVAGQVTALPGGHEIEVANHSYHIKQGSAAEKAVVGLSIGQQVHLIIDSSGDPSKGEVVAISVDSES